MHPFWAGYRTPNARQKLIVLLSALAGFVVSGIYFAVALPRPDVPPAPVPGVVRQPMSSSPEGFIFLSICCVLFFAATYGTGMLLYRYFADTQGYTVVSANAGQHMPLLLLMAGVALASEHGTKAYWGSAKVTDWVMLAVGIALLGISLWGLYRATVVNRDFYRRFYKSK
jgi:hypothetical protein